MQYVQLNPVYIPPIEPRKSGEIMRVAGIRPVKAVAVGNTMLPQHVIESASVTPELGTIEHIGQVRSGRDRRIYCRRISNQHILEDLRCHLPRRRRNQRNGDIETAIDEMA